MKRITVIGGSGFIGTRLVKRLLGRRIFDIEIVDKVISKKYPDLTSLADVRDLDKLRRSVSEDSIIFNLAAEHRDDVKPLTLYDEVNVKGAINICTIAREKNINSLIFTSSVAIYGFAPLGTNEMGAVNPFNDYGRTKYEAEQIFLNWQAENPNQRTLIIVRPTVVFGEQNRGNVYNLLRQIALGQFVMVGTGENRKSMAYVENLAAFLEYGLIFKPGVHVFNYVDKPDFTMNSLVAKVDSILRHNRLVNFRIPLKAGLLIGGFFDFISNVTGKKFPISYIRVKKFCANSVYNTSIDQTDFVAPISLEEALAKTVRYEFIETHEQDSVFYTE